MDTNNKFENLAPEALEIISQAENLLNNSGYNVALVAYAIS
ncbi:MAG: hypothetical protein RR313_06175 [Anaerovoracaceae bacterium]